MYDSVLDPECNVCKFKRVISHVHQGVLVSGTPATCTQEGSKEYYICTCQQAFEDEACTRPITDLDSWKVIQPIPHIWSGTYLAENADESKHYHLCTVCGTKDAGEAHVYDNTEDIDCSICGYERQVTPPVGTEFTVNFDPNGGSVSPSSAVTADGRLASLPAPTYDGYDFLGWYTAASGGTRVTTGTVFAADATLYAHWDRRSSGGSSGGGGSEPAQPTVPSTEESDGWTNIQEELGGAEDGDTITVDMNGATEVPGAVLEEVAGKDTSVELDMGGGVSWTINGQDVPEGVSLSDLDLGVSMDTSGISADVINTVSGEYGAVQVSLDHDGEFGFALTLTAPLGRENAGHWANLYHYNEGAETLTFVSSTRIAGDGSAALRMTHASQYAIVIDEKSHALPFEDVPTDHWAYDAILYAYDNGLMAGTSGTTFAPENVTTRGQIVTILWRMAGSPQVNYLMDYSDMDPAAYYAEAIRWATSEGIAGGYGGGVFGPDDPITREQLAVMLHRYAQHEGYDVSIGEDTNILSYTDAFEVSEYAVAALQWACGAGIISGTGDGSTLTPQGEATRAQAATVLMRFCEQYQ